ncbi:MAG TPA: aldolase/citrate lyase family protein [Candidatus Sulfotelmatobacter sp.]|nr:aldolase/citrate lyase family protein [Candidatus Sulfotelmatobacter sp.]
MTPERLRQSLAARAVLHGTWVQTPSPEVVEILGWSGWDFVILDLEHGPYGAETLGHLIRAADASGTSPFVRVPLSAPHDVGRALDLGAAGIVWPGVTSAEAGAAAVRLTRFPPAGSRGSSPSTRQLHYSAIPFTTLTARDAQQPLAVLQVEARLATSDLGSILGIEGLDVVFIGAYDLSLSLGLPGQFDHAKVREAITEIVTRAGDRGVAVGIWVPDAEAARFWAGHGVRFVTVSNNELMLFNHSSALRRSLDGSAGAD